MSALEGSPAYLECSIVGTCTCPMQDLLKRIETICGGIEKFEHYIWELVPLRYNEEEEEQVIDRPILLIHRKAELDSKWLESASASDKSAIRTCNVRTIKKLILEQSAHSPEEIAALLGMKILGTVRKVNGYIAKHFNRIECVVNGENNFTLRIEAGNQAGVAFCEANLFQIAILVQDLVPVMNRGF
jgi:hypothetical protein